MRRIRLKTILYTAVAVFVISTISIFGIFTFTAAKRSIYQQSLDILHETSVIIQNSLGREFLLLALDESEDAADGNAAEQTVDQAAEQTQEHDSEPPEQIQDRLQQQIESLSDASQTRITIINPSGRVLADSAKDPLSLDNHKDREEIRAAFQTGAESSSQRYSDSLNITMIYYAVPIFSEAGTITGVLRTSLPFEKLEAYNRQMYLYFSIGGILFLAAAAVLIWAFSRIIERPLSSLAAAADQYADLNFRQIPDLQNGPEEIESVASAMRQMAVRLSRQFTAIQLQRDELQAVLDSMSEAVIVLDEQGRITEANPAASAFFQEKQESPFLLKPLKFAVSSHELENLVQQTLRDASPRSAELSINSSDYQVHISPIPNQQNTATRAKLLLVFNNITTLMHLERVRKDFVANVSHELKTPVTSIRGFAETLLDHLQAENSSETAETAQDPESLEIRFLSIIMRQSERLQSIIDDLLTLSRLEQNHERSHDFTSVQLEHVISEAVSICREKAMQPERIIRITCPGNTAVQGNGNLLEQAVINLLDNALKYSEPDSAIDISCAENQQTVTILVKDSGYGIPKTALNRIFERFYRVDKARSRDKGGTGLGLSIVRHIALLHHGSVSVESTEGIGSVFSLTLPLRHPI